MHGFSSGSTLLANAEVDSMGGVIDSGVGIGTKTSPRGAAIEKAQSELRRLEYDVREERRRELEFLENGGDPLDFKFGLAASVSVQSTSLADHHLGQFVASEAKGSFALGASPRGDSVESSGRLGTTVACEPDSADNFDVENELLEGERKSKYPRSSITPSEHSSQLDGSQNARESEESPNFQPKKAYTRRYRSKPTRDSVRTNSTDIAFCGGNGSLPSDHSIIQKPVLHEIPFGTETDVGVAASDKSKNDSLMEGKLDISSSRDMLYEVNYQNSKDVGEQVAAASVKDNIVVGGEDATHLSGDCPCSVAEKSDKCSDNERISESNQCEGGDKGLQTEGVSNTLASNLRGLDSESSCSQPSISIDGNGTTEIVIQNVLKNGDVIGEPRDENIAGDKTLNSEDEKDLKERSVSNVGESNACTNDICFSQSHQTNGFFNKAEEEINKNSLSAQNEVKGDPDAKDMQTEDHTEFALDSKKDVTHESDSRLESSVEKPEGHQELSVNDVANTGKSEATTAIEHQPCGENQMKLNKEQEDRILEEAQNQMKLNKEQEDRILEEAHFIEAKRKRIAELSLCSSPKDYRRNSHWDFVLEEMAWLANDFSQERIWKVTAAAQICQRAAFASRSRLEERCKLEKPKFVARTLAKAVMEFWCSAGLQTGSLCGLKTFDHDGVASENTEDIKNDVEEIGDKDSINHGKSIRGYAVRFLQHNSSMIQVVSPGYFGSPNDASINGTLEVTCENRFSKENLFYLVPQGAVQAYRNSIEKHIAQFEKTGKNMQEEFDTAVYEAASEFGSQENAYEEDEGESTHYLPGAYGRSKSSKFTHKKTKTLKARFSRSYEMGGDFSYSHCIENKNSTPQSTLVAKRPNGLSVSPIPTKRMRTASRQRVVGPFGGGAYGILPAPSRADASSGDTNSFQDDQSSLHGGSFIPKGSEVESGMDYDKQSSFDTGEIFAKPKKKKKEKHQGMAYDQRWQTLQSEQRDNSKKRMDNHQFESNGSSGLFGPYAKKQKLIKQPLEHSYENTTLMSGCVASPAASQMSNMSNPGKLFKLIGSRDGSRKAKGLKAVSGQPGSGSPWSLFEDQALVVLVHDMGTNWELVSDAINSSLQFKRIFRMPKECKERHKALMDMNSGDGADSAEDSGSSQPYPSTLPGIPKGSARQLFQQLRGPMEEDTIRSHFEKIMSIGQKLHSIGKQEPKQLVAVHASHAAALMQVLPNYVNGAVLTPFDLIDVAASSPDVFSFGYQGPHSGGLALPNQGLVQPMLTPGPNPSIQGSPGMSIGTNLSLPSAQLNGPMRDGRYVPRGGVPMDDQQRIQQQSPMVSGRSMQHPNMSVPGTFQGSERGARMVPGGNGVTMIPGMNRSMPLPHRPAVQGLPSTSMLNSGSVGASNMMGLNMHPGGYASQGNSMIRPRDALHMVRAGQNLEHSRPMVPSEMQMQANSRGHLPFGGISSPYPSQSSSPSVPSYAAQHQQHNRPMSQQQQHPNHLNNSPHLQMQGSAHVPTPEQQAFALRLARERQLQQRMLQRHNQQQLTTSSALMSHPISTSSLTNSPQIQQAASSQSVSVPPPLTPSSPMTPVGSQQKQPHPHSHPHGLGRIPQSGVGVSVNQGVGGRQQKQRQAQQTVQQSGRHHPQQRQPSNPQPQQQAKMMKGVGRGNLLMHQQSGDLSHLNGLSGNNSRGQVMDKGDQSMQVMQGQGYPTQKSKPMIPTSSSQSHPLSKPFPSSTPSSLTQSQQLTSRPDVSSHSQMPIMSPVPAVPVSAQGLQPSVVPSFNSNQQLKGHPPQKLKLVNHNSLPSAERAALQNRGSSSDAPAKSQADQVEQPLANNSSSMSMPTSGVPPVSIEPRDAGLTCDSVMLNSTSQLAPIGSSALTNSSGNEPLGSGGLRAGPKHLSNTSHGHGGGSQWAEQQQPLLKQSLRNQSLLPQKQTQQQPQLEQSAKSSTLLREQPQPQYQAAQCDNLSRSNSDLE